MARLRDPRERLITPSSQHTIRIYATLYIYSVSSQMGYTAIYVQTEALREFIIFTNWPITQYVARWTAGRWRWMVGSNPRLRSRNVDLSQPSSVFMLFEIVWLKDFVFFSGFPETRNETLRSCCLFCANDFHLEQLRSWEEISETVYS